jgi:subtilisin
MFRTYNLSAKGRRKMTATFRLFYWMLMTWLGTGSWVLAEVIDRGPIPDQFIITMKSGEQASVRAAEMEKLHGLKLAHLYGHVLNGFAAHVPPERLKALQEDSRVASVVQDHYVHADAQTIPMGIERIYGDISTAVSGDGAGSVSSINVAVIDTGIDLKHPDLNVVGGKNCSTGRSYADGNGHGTHVAGTIGAKDNGIGVVGVVPGARLWSVRVLDNSGNGAWSSIICGINFVMQNARTIKIANMSLGGEGTDTGCNDGGLHQAICNAVKAGVTFVVAAGNESGDAANHVPAAYDEVITVSALADFDGIAGGLSAPTCRTDEDDTFADFSNYGADVDMIAPGVCIYSTWKGKSYATLSGTSMATPHVAGAAALYIANNPGKSPAEVKAALQGAGNLDWFYATDPDAFPEVLLNIDTF